jgi:ABC-type nitrate/sulfonate/bicarbonate transport system substrate-binding protein
VRTIIAEDREVGRWQQWRKVASGEAQAVICSPLYEEAALEAGLHVLDVPKLPELGQITFAALGPFVASHEDELRRFTRALYRAIHAFRHEPEVAVPIVAGEPARLMGLANERAIRRRYEGLRAELDDRPIPRLEALASTVATLHEHYHPLDGLNPLAMWDLRFVLELEEARFMEHLA